MGNGLQEAAASEPKSWLIPNLADRFQGICEETARYQVFITRDAQLIDEAQALRFRVFNLEMNEGLEASFLTGRDHDAYDDVCDHLVVMEKVSGTVVGTYRLQTGVHAKRYLGYYSASEFDLGVWDGMRDEVVELGRACIEKAHRNFTVLGLLWKGVTAYAMRRGCRYLVGCSSLTSQDEGEGMALYDFFQRMELLCDDSLQVMPKDGFQCKRVEFSRGSEPKVPKLLRAYLSVGAWIAGEPAIDRAFGTIDFMTLMDLQRLPREIYEKFQEDIRVL